MHAEVKRLVEIRLKLARLEADYVAASSLLKQERDTLQAAITEELTKSGQYSARFKGATVTRSVRKTIRIINELALIAHLKSSGLSSYVSERVDKQLWDSASRELAKQGQSPPGTELEEKEFLSVRLTGSEDDRKVTTD